MRVRASVVALVFFSTFASAGAFAAPAMAQGMSGRATPEARGPTYDPNQEFHAGIAAMGEGKCRTAKENFEHVLDMIPDQPAALSMLAQCEVQLNDLHGAARDFEASLRSDPKQIIPARDLAITDEKLGRRDKAQAQLQKLKARATACAEACTEAGDLDGAVRDVEAAMAPASPAARAKAPAG
jgi:predicted Zn-dependent protease